MQTNNDKKMSKRLLAVILMAAVLCMTALTATAYAQPADDESSTEETTTTEINTDMILDKANLTLSDDDTVERRDQNGLIAITIHRAFNVYLTVNGKTQTLSYTDGTVDDVLKDNNIEINNNDVLNYLRTDELFDSIEIKIEKNIDVTLSYGGKDTVYTVPSGSTVQQVVETAGIDVDEKTTTSMPLDTVLNENQSLSVSTYKIVTETKTVAIDYDTKTENTSKLYKGKTEVKTAGVEGSKEVTATNTYVDGKCVSSKEISSKVIKEPVTQVTLVGTKEKVHTFTDASGKSVSYKKVLNGSGTAYTAPAGAGTATGVKAYKGGVAVNPNIIPYGTKLYIVGTDGFVYGYAIAVDTGGALMSGTALVDCYYSTYNECVQFGRRNVNVYILG